MMIYLYAFLVGGLICALAEFIKCMFKLTVGHTTVLFVVIGTFLDFFNFYDKLIEFAGAGAILPITSFGHSLAHASFNRAMEDGYICVFTGIFDKTSGGIAFAILIAVIIGLIFKPKK